MDNTKSPLFAETSEHAARLNGDDTVDVFRKAQDGAMVPLGRGRWEGGIIRGSGVNCGVLVLLERDLRDRLGEA